MQEKKPAVTQEPGRKSSFSITKTAYDERDGAGTKEGYANLGGEGWERTNGLID